MADDLLQRLDDGFAARTARRLSGATAGARARVVNPRPVPARERVATIEPAPVLEARRTIWDHVGWIEAFVAVQFMWGALLFMPGAQQYRGYIRALPYLSCFAMFGLFVVHRVREPLARGAALLIAALLLLVLNLVHPTSNLLAGVAQCVFQLCIASPMFWAHKAVRSPRLLERLLVLIFAMNTLSAGLGVLQVYYPERFMPSEFNSLGLQMNKYYVDGLTYRGAGGRLIVRPPGLTDQPGAAATAGALAALLGFGFLLRRRNALHTAFILGAITVGFASIYLSQVRSTLLATVGAAALLGLVAIRRGRTKGASFILIAGAAIIVASFAWASALGGESVSDRFSGLSGSGAIDAYRTGRGGFVNQTMGELLDQYPLGAGVGRWGMMNTYFGNPFDDAAPPIYVEIQLTGWLLDGGVLMWLIYGGAILGSLWYAFTLTAAPDEHLSEVAIIVLTLQAHILVMAMGAPVFNTQQGILFWALAAMLHGARHAMIAYGPDQPGAAR